MKFILIVLLFSELVFAQSSRQGIYPLTPQVDDLFIKFTESTSHKGYFKVSLCDYSEENSCKSLMLGDVYYKLGDLNFNENLLSNAKIKKKLIQTINFFAELALWSVAYECIMHFSKRNFSNSWLFKEQKEFALFNIKMTKNGIVNFLTIGSAVGYFTSVLYNEAKDLSPLSNVLDDQKYDEFISKRENHPLKLKNENRSSQKWLLREHHETNMTDFSDMLSRVILRQHWNEDVQGHFSL